MEKTQRLTHILKRLNSGEDPEAVKTDAKELLASVSPDELALAEQNLLDEGLSVEDLHGLCPIHMEMLGEQVSQMQAQLPKGHLVSTLVHEHDAILGFLDLLGQLNQTIQQMPAYPGPTHEFRQLAHVAEHLAETERHHQREEEVLFPELEKRGMYGPPMVMREEHNQLRPRKRQLKELVETVDRQDFATFKRHLAALTGFIVPTLRDHIYKENNILYPAALQVIDDESVWQRLHQECDTIGYCCFTPEA
ncbi:MAG: DUF438 domain-containing protein [Planctomycetes bacterium]|nr:DUF438 domain-containing protein [Planctomycetota bacterium]